MPPPPLWLVAGEFRPSFGHQTTPILTSLRSATDQAQPLMLSPSHSLLADYFWSLVSRCRRYFWVLSDADILKLALPSPWPTVILLLFGLFPSDRLPTHCWSPSSTPSSSSPLLIVTGSGPRHAVDDIFGDRHQMPWSVCSHHVRLRELVHVPTNPPTSPHLCLCSPSQPSPLSS